MKEYQIKVTSVDYCVEEEDVCTEIDNDPEIEEDSEEYYDAIHKRIAEIKAELPQELDLEITCEPEDLEDEIADAISDETDWLNNSFTYDVVSEKEVDDDDYPDAIGSEDDDDDYDDEEESEYDFFENIEIEVKGHTVYLAHDGSSGCEYGFSSKDELKQIIADYVADVIDYDYED